MAIGVLHSSVPVSASRLSVWSAYVFLRHGGGQDRLVHWFVAAAYLGTAFYSLIRAVFNVFMGPTDQHLMSVKSAIQTFYFIIEISLRLVLAIGLPLLVLGRTYRLLVAGERRYRTMIELSPAPLVVLENDVLRYANPSAVAMLGTVSADELIGKSFLDFVPADLRPFVSNRIRTALATGVTNRKVEEKLSSLDGAAIEGEVQSTPILYDGRTALQVIMNEITERKISGKKILSLLREKENLLKEVHHRVKNNIASIESLLSMQIKESANEEVQSKLQGGASRIERRF